MRRVFLVGIMVVSFGLVGVDFSMGEVYYVCWKRAKKGFTQCTKCTEPKLSQDPVLENSRSRCPGEKGQDFNSHRAAMDWISSNCDCP
jgi:hypothetical protein